MRTICIINSIVTALATVAPDRGARINGCKEEVYGVNSNFVSHIHNKYLVCLNTAIYCTETNCSGLYGVMIQCRAAKVQ